MVVIATVVVTAVVTVVAAATVATVVTAAFAVVVAGLVVVAGIVVATMMAVVADTRVVVNGVVLSPVVVRDLRRGRRRRRRSCTGAGAGRRGDRVVGAVVGQGSRSLPGDQGRRCQAGSREQRGPRELVHRVSSSSWLLRRRPFRGAVR
ncbi:hypothetical protein ACFP8W_14595 [Nocardioides hankookensis]